MPGFVGEVGHRLGQGARALRAERMPEHSDAVLASVLTAQQAAAFRALPAFDQIHLLEVHQCLKEAGVTDLDLQAAGLLHDIGKIDAHGRVRLPDRVARVVLRRVSPGLLTRLAASSSPGLLHGLYLCVHHPRLGAERARALGCTERTIELIARHEDEGPHFDDELRLLQQADRG
jgi:putative nucleotidyltransferase with HDIG domain